MTKHKKNTTKNPTEIEPHLFGLSSVQYRKETLKSRAAVKLKQGEKALKDASKLASQCEKESRELIQLAEKLDTLNSQAIKSMVQLTQQGKKRLDGKRAFALNARSLGTLCGLVEANTLLYCVGDEVELRSMSWADSWVVDMLAGLSSSIPASEMSKFYDFMQKHKEDRNVIESEAGLLILRNQ
jgi:superfamily II RNA helicase